MAGGPYYSGAGGDLGNEALKPFGAQVRFLRERAGLKREEFGKEVGYSPEMVRSVEAGRRFPSPEFVDAAERVLKAEGVLKVAQQHLTRSRVRFPPWFRDFVRLEAEAVTLCAYECRVAPGLLQTEEYARAVFRSVPPPLDDEQIEQKVATRFARQSLLTRKPLPSLTFILEQSVLERCLGGEEVTRQQLDHLRQCAEQRNIQLQIMPLRQENHAGVDGPMYLLETEENRWLGYFEGQRGSLLISDSKEVSIMLQRYAALRSQALTPVDSKRLLERLRGEL